MCMRGKERVRVWAVLKGTADQEQRATLIRAARQVSWTVLLISACLSVGIGFLSADAGVTYSLKKKRRKRDRGTKGETTAMGGIALTPTDNVYTSQHRIELESHLHHLVSTTHGK